MSSSLFSIGTSGLNAAHAGLLTAGNNIANANTPGYSRQRIEQSDSGALYTGSGYMGQGVQVDSIRREYSALLAAETRGAQSLASYAQAFSTQLVGIDNMMANPSQGVPAAIDAVYSSLGDVAARPSDASARQAFLSCAESLAGQLQSMSSQLSTQRKSADAGIIASVAQINTVGAQIARLNQQIALAMQSAKQQPNDLMDQRDTLAGALAQQVNTNIVVTGAGEFNVFLANGQPLVLGALAQAMVARPDPQDQSNVQVGLQIGNSVVAYGSASITGGALGGLLAFRDQVLNPAQNAIGRMALAFGAAFNAQQQLGLDATGAPGAPMFSLGAPVVLSQSAATVSATISDYAALTTSDYRLKFDGANYTLTRLSDGSQTTFANFPQTVDGVTYDLSPPVPAPSAGDAFVVEPTRDGAMSLRLLLSDPRQVAAAAPIRTAAGSTNISNAQIDAGGVTAAYPATPLAAPQVLAYDSAAGSLTGFPAASPVTVTVNGASTVYPAGTPVPFTSGASIQWDGLQVRVSGTPADGDTFTIAPNTGASGDNRNALALAALQTAPLLGGTTIREAYTMLVSSVGNKASQMKMVSTAQASALAQARAANDSISGVNLDEEAADLLRFQQAYQAAGKVIGIASMLFETIINISAR